MNTSSTSSLFKKAFFTYICSKGQSKFAESDRSILTVMIFAMGEKVEMVILNIICN